MYRPSYRTKKNNVPVLSKIEIDTIAENYIADFCPEALNQPMEIDVDSFILNYLGLKQDFHYLSHNGIYLGMTVFNDTSKVPVYIPESKEADYVSVKARTVIIDNTLLEGKQEHRYRYTMGHEGGHDIFHSEYFAYDENQLSLFERQLEPLIQCRAVAVNGKQKPPTSWTDKERMEWQANYFSSALLMPKSMVKSFINTLSIPNENIKYQYYISQISKKFNVSLQAAKYRLEGLNIIPVNKKNYDFNQIENLF